MHCIRCGDPDYEPMCPSCAADVNGYTDEGTPRQQEEVTTMTVTYCTEHDAYFEGAECPACTRTPMTLFHIYTAFCALPDSPRGEYDDEIDVVMSSRSTGRARRIAEAAIDLDYQPDLKVRRVSKRW